MLYDDIANYEKCMVLLEVHSEIEQEGSIMRFVKTVVADVGKADVVGEVSIEHIVADAATDAQTAIQAAEVVAAEGTLGLSLGKVLDLATYTHGEVTAELWLDGEVVIYIILIFQHRRNLQVVEVVGHLLAGNQIFLATFFYIGETCLQIQRRCIRERNAGNNAYVEARLPVTAIQTGIIRIHVGECRTDSETEVWSTVTVVVSVVEMSRLLVVISTILIVLSC